MSDFFILEGVDKESRARTGLVKTAHGAIPTPAFMPVGTAGTVKAIHQRELKEDIQTPVILGNTYHLYLRPGLDILRTAGGLHKFMGWDGAILTDSGGYQVYSLAAQRKIREEGAEFSSHIDGSRHMFSPESVIEMQRIIGADIIMAFDECTPYPCEEKAANTSMELTHRWLDRCITAFNNSEPLYGYDQHFFPIVQGSIYPELRKRSAEFIASKECVGNAIGGLSVGEPAEEMYSMTSEVCRILPADKPRYLMGVGTPVNLLECIALGVDMFDCVMPTRNARHGLLFTQNGVVHIKNEQWKSDLSVLDPMGTSFVDKAYSKAYLRHLFAAGEILASQIASLHNLAFYQWLVSEARNKIKEGVFAYWKSKMIIQLSEKL